MRRSSRVPRGTAGGAGEMTGWPGSSSLAPQLRFQFGDGPAPAAALLHPMTHRRGLPPGFTIDSFPGG